MDIHIAFLAAGAAALVGAPVLVRSVRRHAAQRSREDAVNGGRQCPVCEESLPLHAVACRYCGHSLMADRRAGDAGAVGEARPRAGARPPSGDDRPQGDDRHFDFGKVAQQGADEVEQPSGAPRRHAAARDQVPPQSDLPWTDENFARLRGQGGSVPPDRAADAARPSRPDWKEQRDSLFAAASDRRSPAMYGAIAAAIVVVAGAAALGVRLFSDEPDDRGAATAAYSPAPPPSSPRISATVLPTDPAAPSRRAGEPEEPPGRLTGDAAAALVTPPDMRLLPLERPPMPEAGEKLAPQGDPAEAALAEPTSIKQLPVPMAAPPAERTVPAPVAAPDANGAIAEQPPQTSTASPRPKALAPVARDARRGSGDTAGRARPQSPGGQAALSPPPRSQAAVGPAPRAAQPSPPAAPRAAPAAPSPAQGQGGDEVMAVGELVEWLQSRLASLGYYSGPINGRAGPETSRAILAYQRGKQLTPTGRINEALIVSLRRSAGQPIVLDRR